MVFFGILLVVGSGENVVVQLFWIGRSVCNGKMSVHDVKVEI